MPHSVDSTALEKVTLFRSRLQSFRDASHTSFRGTALLQKYTPEAFSIKGSSIVQRAVPESDAGAGGDVATKGSKTRRAIWKLIRGAGLASSWEL